MLILSTLSKSSTFFSYLIEISSPVCGSSLRINLPTSRDLISSCTVVTLTSKSLANSNWSFLNIVILVLSISGGYVNSNVELNPVAVKLSVWVKSSNKPSLEMRSNFIDRLNVLATESPTIATALAGLDPGKFPPTNVIIGILVNPLPPFVITMPDTLPLETKALAVAPFPLPWIITCGGCW